MHRVFIDDSFPCAYQPHVISKDWPPELGSIFNTSVLAWSYEDASFWRGKSVSCAEVVSYAKSMALTRFREVGLSLFAEIFVILQ